MRGRGPGEGPNLIALGAATDRSALDIQFQSETVARPEATKFAADSPLEGDGFELLVPLQPNRVPPAARTRRARLRAIALRRSSTWVWPVAMLADAAPHLSYEEGESVGYVLLQGKSCGVSGTASLLDHRGGSAQPALLRSGSVVSQPSAPGGPCRQCLGYASFRARSIFAPEGEERRITLERARRPEIGRTH